MYGLYFRETYKTVKEKNPGASFGKISRELSKQWEVLCPECKLSYKKRVSDARKEYKRKLKLSTQSLPNLSPQHHEKKGKDKHMI